MRCTCAPRFLAALSALLLSAVPAPGVAAGAKAYVGNFKDNTVSVIDTGSGAVVATVPVAAGPHGMGVSPDGRTVYVSGDGSSSVSVIDTASDRVTQTIEVGGGNGIYGTIGAYLFTPVSGAAGPVSSPMRAPARP